MTNIFSSFQFGVPGESLHCQILGLLGFSRLCQGFTYEVHFKLCKQSWKAKCKLEPLGQSWVEPEFTFQINYNDDLKVKVSEIGSAVRRSQVIGSIVCPVQNFLNITPQAYLLPLNTTGTIKLKLGAIWRPCNSVRSSNIEYTNNYSNMVPLAHSLSASSPTSPQPPFLDPQKSGGSFPAVINQLSSRIDNEKVNNDEDLKAKRNSPAYSQSFLSSDNISKNRQSSSFKELKNENVTTPQRKASLNDPVNNIKTTQVPIKSNYSPTANKITNVQSIDQVISNYNNKQNKDNISQNETDSSTNDRNFISLKMDDRSSINEIIDVCQSIVQSLKLKPKIMEQCTSLISRIFIVKDSMMQLKNSYERKASLTDSISDALDTFSFLSDLDETEKSSKTVESQPSIQTVTILRNQWKKCYRVLYHHVCSIKEAIDASQPANSPLKEMEKIILPHITKQLEFINIILKIASTPDEIELSQVCSTYCGSSTLSNTWEVSSSSAQPLYCTEDCIINTLKILEEHSRRINPSQANVCHTDEVCRKALSRLQEGFKSDKEILSLFQFINFFKKLKSNNVSDFLVKLRKEATIVNLLQSKDDLIVLTALHQLGNALVENSIFHQILTLLVTGSTLVINGAVKSIIKMFAVEANQNEMLSLIAVSLEENDIYIRAGACVAIAKLKIISATTKLKYLLQTDHLTVKEAASNALIELGQLKT
ncbi:RIPOR family member 3 isoform X1 [Hydra vulgaris]|uniref:RIPOR family member 3 isoform X1 n=1 Tax=Hydra vulgaris TaxID=6087 RepID=UPI001F5FC7CD|nr:RIPOR family member 3 isoform X1 [Hydra vulgaris]